MSGRYPAFDPAGLELKPLSERDDDLRGDFMLPLKTPAENMPPGILQTGQAIREARRKKATVIFLCGAHVLRSGVQLYLFDLMQKGFIQGLAVNGAMAIHDFEIALRNSTTESVRRYVKDGRFGLWRETGRINDIIKTGWREGLGFGEALGRELAEGEYAYKDRSLFATAWRLGIPVTVHVGIGYDIIHSHPNFDAQATGAASYRDFLIFANLLDNLENGVVCTFGSSVMAPEVFLKALSMVRNVAVRQGRQIAHFTSLVCDLHDLPGETSAEASKKNHLYYFRPWKTLLSRTVSDGGRSYYVKGEHARTIPWLWAAINKQA